MRDKHTNYLDSQISDSIAKARKVEEEWLASIGAPVKQLPDNVAKAAAERVFLSSMPMEFTRYLSEQINFNRIIKQINERR